MSVPDRVLRGLRPSGGLIVAVWGLLALAVPVLGVAAPPVGPPGADAPSAAVSERECTGDDDDEETCVRGGAYASPFQEYADRLRSAQEVSPLTSELLGDSVNLHDGQTSFTNVDIDVPGNGLPVQLRRRLSITRLGVGEQIFGGFGNWDVDVPYIVATLPASDGWSGRCSTPFKPVVTGDIRLEDFWSGVSVHVPGGIDSELYYLPGSGSTLHPTDGTTYRWTTSDHSVFHCSVGTSGETFHMITPEGTKYTFDTLVSRTITTLRIPWITTYGFTNQTRQRRYLLASKVEDRYGNRVEYSYNGSGYPTLIRSYPVGETTIPDRQIALTYTDNRVTSATAHGRTWTYEYTSGLRYVYLPTDVDIPTGLRPRWSYEYVGDRVIQPQIWDGSTTNCTGPPNDTGYYEVKIDHPGGAHGDFVFDYHRLARTGVDVGLGCLNPGGPVPRFKLLIPYFADNFALQTKTLSGAGLLPLTWQYFYDAGTPTVGWPGMCNSTTAPCSAQPAERWVQVTEPDATKKRYRFGIKYKENFGRLLGTETHAAGTTGTLLASTDTVYYTGTASPFPNRYGFPSGTNEDIQQLIRPVTSRSETRQGVTFTASTPVGQFDRFARPLQVTRASGLGYTRTETITYVDKTSTAGGAANVWILGRIGTKTISGFGAAAESYTYHAATLDRNTETRFGTPQRTLGWHADGMLHWVQDGASQQTTLTNYYRGVPRTITYADGTYQEATLNAFGQITSVRNEAGYTTSYSYTNDGRLSGISYPAGDTVAWTPTTVAFVPTTDSSLGVSGTHWRQTVTTGTGRKTVDLDAFWRPVTTLEEDTSNALTRRYVTRDFDHAGRETFVSYPSTGISAEGTLTEYDALGRPLFIRSDSELGLLTLVTKIRYLSGFEKEVTNPRDFVTTTRYQVFDTPSEDAPYQIDDAFGTTTINRNVLGAPISMVRTGTYAYPVGSGGGSVTLNRTTSYVYDTAQRLCKTVEPESGATIMAYDLADNVQWRATGQTLTGGACDNTSPSTLPGVANLTYDDRNRLQNTLYSGASTPNIFRTYTPDGLLETVSSDGSTRAYTYNRRRLPNTEQLTLTGLAAGSWMITHGWHVNGYAASLTYPDGMKLNYVPNGLGQPTKVVDPVGGPGGTELAYANNVTYHPTGEIAGFTYGNGVAYSMTPNARGLPQQVSHGIFVKDSYVWDKNGNLTNLTDTRTPVLQPRTRSMTYDARDRVETTTYAYNGRTFTYGYDLLDNLRTTRETPVGRNHRHEYAADGRLTRIVDPAASSTAVIGYTYDARGNATSRTSATGFVPNATSIVVDEASRVRSATVGADTETFTYDGLGRRTRTTTGFSTQMHFYSQPGQLLLWETPGNEIKTRQYNLYLGNQWIARKHMTSLAYVHTDHLGSPLSETTPVPATLVNSNPIWEPYGAPAGGAFWGGLQFTGHYQDRTTRLTYMQQRYYDPYAGRFLAVDPVAASPGSFNRYWYANNNPYKYVDPDGRQVEHKSLNWRTVYVPAQGRTTEQTASSAGTKATAEAFKAGGKAVAEEVVPGLGCYNNGCSVGEGIFEAATSIPVLKPLKALKALKATMGTATEVADVTKAGSRYANIAAKLTPEDFQANLISNGYNVIGETVGSNGPVTILSNGAKTYTIYTGTSTGAASAQVTNAAGEILSKIRLSEP
ncbi:RHS repeat domain-containing protein [Dokdonella koreensis]|uniref:Wall associated protein n=1 Tax=Dokdonella koreensis DS-123 TaxID=1300342 RepID=A0A167GLX0_9GAMM|nr:RHS repeat-associated core domain-containing protein [Dokdonella koreensis]ANB16711.1 Wall associated protein [Dokdonella koreensis DS-123]